jgi:hypothetical protein
MTTGIHQRFFFFTGAPEQEKRAAYETLWNIYPTQTAVLERLQRTNR